MYIFFWRRTGLLSSFKFILEKLEIKKYKFINIYPFEINDEKRKKSQEPRA